MRAFQVTYAGRGHRCYSYAKICNGVFPLPGLDKPLWVTQVSPSIQKFALLPRHFYGRPTLVPDLFSLTKRNPEDFHLHKMVNASLLYAISAYERFHRNALLSERGKPVMKFYKYNHRYSIQSKNTAHHCPGMTMLPSQVKQLAPRWYTICIYYQVLLFVIIRGGYNTGCPVHFCSSVHKSEIIIT